MKKLVILVTNDIHQDQRMHRIATSLSSYFEVTIVGRVKPTSQRLDTNLPYHIYRHNCTSESGIRFYAEIALKHFQYLNEIKPEIVYAVDADTLMPATIYKKKSNCKLIYDAHEWFVEVPELQGEMTKKYIWKVIERNGVKHSDIRLTVSPGIAQELQKAYSKPFEVIRNLPFSKNTDINNKKEKIILYQGMLNAGRGLEPMIKAMDHLPNHHLHIVGEGDLSSQLRTNASEFNQHQNIHFLGWKTHAELKSITEKAWIGINLLEAKSKSYYYSLANKFFDYIQANVPVITMDFPEYRNLNQTYQVGKLVPDLQVETIVNAVQYFDNEVFYQNHQMNCQIAAKELNWEVEEQKLIKLISRLQ